MFYIASQQCKTPITPDSVGVCRQKSAANVELLNLCDILLNLVDLTQTKSKISSLLMMCDCLCSGVKEAWKYSSEVNWAVTELQVLLIKDIGDVTPLRFEVVYRNELCKYRKPAYQIFLLLGLHCFKSIFCSINFSLIWPSFDCFLVPEYSQRKIESAIGSEARGKVGKERNAKEERFWRS